MKTIKIYAVPSHVTDKRMSGVDFARVVQPMNYLNGFELDDYKFEVKVYDVIKDKKDADWRKIAKEYDIIFFNYTVSAWAFAYMGAMVRKENKIMVLDVDDSLWDVQPDNPSYIVFQKDKEHIKNFTAICNEVDYITTTNKYLKNVIIHNTNQQRNRIDIFPNYIDLDIYKFRPRFKDTNEIQLIHFGSTTHFADLANKEFADGIDRIFKNYPNVKLLTVGAFNPRYKRRWGTRYNNGFGDRDVYTWINEKFPGYMEESDILVVPLEDNIYTKCKSNIKWLEASSAKLPGVYQDMRQYSESIEEGKTGFLAKRSKDWYKGIKKMIDNKDLRKEVGENAFKEIKENWQMKDHVKEYAEFFKGILLEQGGE